MNKRRVLIANLAKGAIGEQAANLLGSLLISHLQLVAMERGSLPATERVTFFVHIGEFQTFSSDAFASLLSEARKFFHHFALANQYCDQLSNTVRSALIGNAAPCRLPRRQSRTRNCSRRNSDRWSQAVSATRSHSLHGCGGAQGGIAVFVEGKLYPSRGTAAAIREQSRQRFGRSRGAIERQRQIRF